MQFKTVSILVPNNDFLLGENDSSLELQFIIETLKNMEFDIRKISVTKEEDKSVSLELTIMLKSYDFVILLAKSNPICVSKALANITLQEYSLQRESEIKWPKSIKMLKASTHVHPIFYLQRMFILELGYVIQQMEHLLKTHLTHYKHDVQYLKTFEFVKNGRTDYFKKIAVENAVINYEYTDKIDIVTLTSNSFEQIVNAEIMMKEKLITYLNGRWVNQMVDLIYHSKDKHIQLAIDAIGKCLGKYQLDNVFLSFNGGKDCTVLLHLVQTVIEKQYPDQRNKKLLCLYVRSENAFKEQDLFIEQCKIYFNLEIVTVSANIKDALKIMLEKQPHLKACFMGTRRTDPYSSHLNIFEVTDPGWPQVMRCSPLLDWYYSDIWDYLLYYKIPYCKLYDYGYTSLGNTTNTIRNPSLLYLHEDDRDIYLPAYKMMIDKKERSGRNISKM